MLDGNHKLRRSRCISSEEICDATPCLNSYFCDVHKNKTTDEDVEGDFLNFLNNRTYLLNKKI
jgi:hypothetical protein